MRKMTKRSKNINSYDVIGIDGKEFRRYYHEGDVPSSYFVSGDGEVYSDISKTILKQRKNHKGYWIVTLNQGTRRVTRTVHKMVALTFVGPIPADGYQVDHVDGNKENNHYTNLEWVTTKENTLRAWRLGLVTPNCGDKHHQTTYSDETVRNAVIEVMQGKGVSETADKYGIPRKHFSKITKGKLRRDITEKLGLNYADFAPKTQLVLTPLMIEKIRELRNASKLTYKQIQEELNIKSISTVYNAINKYN